VAGPLLWKLSRTGNTRFVNGRSQQSFEEIQGYIALKRDAVVCKTLTIAEGKIVGVLSE